MRIVDYGDHLYDAVIPLYRARGWNGIPRECLPSTGAVAFDGEKAVAAVFVYLTNSSMGIITMPVTDPAASARCQHDALRSVLDHAEAQLRHHIGQTGLIVTWIAHRGMQHVYKARGYQVGETNMASMILPIGQTDFDFMTPDEEESHV